ncbi:MAG: hypothetical protein AAF050_00660 [Cyanobacteria bacterium J06649_5]
MIKKISILGAIACSIAVLFVFLKFSGFPATAAEELNWQPVIATISEETLGQLIEAHSDFLEPDEFNSILDSALAYEKDDLVLVDFNTERLCGRAGCLYVGFRRSTGEEILSSYLTVALPSGEPVIETTDRGYTLPCLIVRDVDEVDRTVTKSTFCYQSVDWVLENTEQTVIE